ncbi:Structural maintenance of chromosomes protein 4 [Lithohypha guttulata]|uniref:Structural maintenance of chromosomes protein 4 n=1 Tax=Lithohypha guttulata TaxID=1690604 RepID=UPI002DE108E6|nr:Structural maintenance of chromosomes protein 4 [Lithohypha guttulata]
MESPARPLRRAARKTIVLEEESDDELSLVHEARDDEFTPAPVKTPRRTVRRQTTANTDVSPRKSVRTRKARSGDSVEPSIILEHNPSIVPALPESVSPTKPGPSRKRQSTVPRTSRRSSVAPPTSALPTPAPSASPEAASQVKSKPLADITTKVLNRRPEPVQNGRDPAKLQAQIHTQEAVLERPMDIALRAKAEAATAPLVELDTIPKSRMVIKQLVMTNFKSYAGRQVVGPFHHSFSSVVGPNGSGKSNVIDSLLFVFGFRASKMRQGKISALIHNSAQHQNLDFCEVEVHFQEVVDLPGGKCDIVPDSTMVVSRKAFKNNSSNYYLNGRTTNFTTVTTLLKDRGIDLDHKRFLILQGEVESIAQMKPKAANEHEDGLLEYLEDIIGTSKYKTPIEEAVVELESLNEICVEKQARVQHVEKEKNALEDKKNKAIAFIQQENELAEKQSALYQIYLAECADNVQVTEEAITQMQAHLDAELEKHTGNESSIKELEKEYKRAFKHFDALEKQTQDFLKELARFDKESVKFDEKRKFIVGKQKKSEKTITSSRLAGSEATSLVHKYTDDIEKKTKQIEELERDVRTEEAELAKIRDDLRGKTQGLSEEIAVKQKSLEPWQGKINQKESTLSVAQSELDILLERASAGQKALDDAKNRAEEIKAQKAQKEGEIEERRHELKRLQKDCRKLNDALQKLANSEPEVRNQISSARQKAEEARGSLAATQNQGNVLKGLLRLRDSGRVDGFHGRLGDLGTIDEKYDVAISTACASLENMVVDTVEAGQQCIEYLRKNNLGRANFICLDKLARKDLPPIDTPEDAPRLFDLIKTKDDKFKPAFYSIMHNTLVAKDLEQANRIAYGARRWRVVTLDGQLIDISGTMSGGGTRVARGAMSSKQVADVTKNQVDELEAERDELESQFKAFLDKQKELEQTLREKQEHIPQVGTAIQKLQLEIDACERNKADAEKQCDDLVKDLADAKTDDSAIKALQKQMAATAKEIQKLHAETATVEKEIQELQNKIMEVGGVRLRSQKGKVDSLKEQISLLTDEVSTAEVAKSKNEKLIIKHEKAKNDAEKELANLAKDAEKLEEDIQLQRSEAGEAKERTEQAQEELETKKDELATMKKDLDEQNAELNKSRAQEIEMKNKLEENQKILADNQKKSKYWTEKLSKLTLHDIKDLDVPIAPKQIPEQEIAQAEEHGPIKGEIVQDTEPERDNMNINNSEENAEPPAQEEEEEDQQNQLPRYSRDELADMSKDHLVAIIAALEEKIANTSNIDLAVIAEYRKRCQDLAVRTVDLNGALKTRDSAKNRLTDLRTLRLTQFMTGFTTISQHLKQMYQLITLGGNAELELVDSLDPFSEGILFSVMPPKKSWKNIGNLSGGEKTLSSLALVFALHVYRPTPLYVMDEIDAALDFRNVSIVAGYIKERTKNAQFIVISLRNNMFELAERLIGIYKVNHMTKSVTVDNKDYIQRQ